MAMMMDDQDIFKMLPRHDTHFILSDKTTRTLDETDTALWAEITVTVLWIGGAIGLLIYYSCGSLDTCCLCEWFNKLRQEPGHEFCERWTVNQRALQEGDPRLSLSPLLLDDTPPSSRRFSDPPPEYSQVVYKADPPSYASLNCVPQDKQIAILIPDRDWTRRMDRDQRGRNN